MLNSSASLASLPGSVLRTHIESLGKRCDSKIVLKALPDKLDIKRHSPSILYLLVTVLFNCTLLSRGLDVVCKLSFISDSLIYIIWILYIFTFPWQLPKIKPNISAICISLCKTMSNHVIWHAPNCGPGLQIRVHIGNLFSSFLRQNICCGYSKEPSQ